MQIKKTLLNLFNDYPISTGVIIIIMASFLLIYTIKNEGPVNFSGRNVASWNVFISIWAIIVMLFVFGGFLLFGNIHFF